MAGLAKAYDSASGDISNKMFPYVFLDQSQQGQLSNYRLYTDIFSAHKISWSVDGMKGYIVGASDFETFFSVLSQGNKFEAIENENSETTPERNFIAPEHNKIQEKQQTNVSLEPQGYDWASESSEEEANEECTTNKERSDIKDQSPKKSIREGLGMASKAAGTSTAPKKPILNESNDMVTRMQKLANIKINQ